GHPMIAPSDASERVAASDESTAAMGPRPLFWSVRRELWEHPYVVLGPLAAASILLASILLGAISRPDRIGDLLEMASGPRHRAVAGPFGFTAAMVALGGFLVALFYSIEALRGERRDRSILFWKSLPVSDATTVLSKAIVVLVVLPA